MHLFLAAYFIKMKLDAITIREIKPTDNAVLAQIIRQTLLEFNAAKPGTVYFDETTDDLYSVFQVPKAVYFVAEADDKLLGGGGIYPTAGLPVDTCELVKMYLLPEARGIGLGKLLIQKSLESAKQLGFLNVYLETMPELKNALQTYEKMGFYYLNGPVGNSGHFGCELWMLKEL